jgi:hypothetical protein
MPRTINWQAERVNSYHPQGSTLPSAKKSASSCLLGIFSPLDVLAVLCAGQVRADPACHPTQ